MLNKGCGGSKEMNEKFSKWSALLSIICAMTLFISYAIARTGVIEEEPAVWQPALLES